MAAPWFRRITFYSLSTSLCPLIPVPLLDDWAVGWLRRRQIAELLRSRGVPPLAWHLDVLSGETASGWAAGCLAYLLKLPVKLVLWLIKKLFRTLLFFLLVKDCVDRFSETFHQGFLLHFALEQELVDGEALAGGHRLHAVHYAIAGTCEAIDPRPLHQLVRRIYRGSRQLLAEAAAVLAPILRAERKRQKAARRQAPSPPPADAGQIDAESGAMTGLLDRLTAALWHEEGYRAQLEDTFLRYFNHAVAPRPTAPGAQGASTGARSPALSAQSAAPQPTRSDPR